MLLTYLLELGGKPAGRFFESRGGTLEADVIRTGNGPIQRKHLSTVRYTDIVMACGPGMSSDFYDWVGSTFSGHYRRMNGAVIALDYASKPVSRLDFRDALVRSLALPELDKSQNDRAALVVTIRPGSTTFKKPAEKQDLGRSASSVAKPWHTSDFRLSIDGLDATVHATRIQSLTFGETLREIPIGDFRTFDATPTRTTFSDLVVDIPLAYSAKFAEWSNESVYQGKSRTSVNRLEKDGSLDFLPPGSSSTYFTVTFNRLGISSVSRNTGGVQIKLYCTSMAFSAA